MSAMNDLTRRAHQTPPPELRTSSIRSSSRGKEALTSVWRGRIPCRQVGSKHPWANWGFPPFSYLLAGNSVSEMLPKNLEHFSPKLKCSAPYQVITKNLTPKSEMPEMLKCHFGPLPVATPYRTRNHVALCAGIWTGTVTKNSRSRRYSFGFVSRSLIFAFSVSPV
jgi:hypothetical protein